MFIAVDLHDRLMDIRVELFVTLYLFDMVFLEYLLELLVCKLNTLFHLLDDLFTLLFGSTLDRCQSIFERIHYRQYILRETLIRIGYGIGFVFL